MSVWKRLASYEAPQRKFWGKAVVIATAGWLALGAGPRLAPPDLAGMYRLAPNRLAPVLRREGDSLHLFLNRPALAAGSAAPAVHLAAWAGYDAGQPLWQEVHALRPAAGWPSAATGQVLTVALAANRLAAGQVLQVSLASPAAQASATPSPTASEEPTPRAWLPLTAERLTQPFVLLDSAGLVLAQPYVRAGASVTVAAYGAGQPVRWRRYATGRAALPPFADPHSQPTTPRTLAVLDSSAVSVAAGQALRLPTAGLYALKVGGLGEGPARTVPLLVTRADFPGQTTAPELIENLLYLTSAAERQQLQQADNPKRAVDRFWLDAASYDQARARELIRRYYGRVTATNELFSGHKAGWLTDRGMLYIVLGPPQSVSRTAGEEHWHYSHAGRLGEAVTFTFRARPATLAPDNYELVRRPEYQTLWYAAVEQWRRPLSAR